MGDDIKITLEDFLEEVKPHHLAKSIDWSGRELMEKPQLGERIQKLLMSNVQLTHIVLGISVKSGNPPPHVHTTISTGFMMGIALVLEVLNEREEKPKGTRLKLVPKGTDTVQ